MSCARTAERVDLPFVDSGGPKEAQVQSYSPGGANVPTWKGTLAPSIANTIGPSVCGGDAVSCQITLTTCKVGEQNVSVRVDLDAPLESENKG